MKRYKTILLDVDGTLLDFDAYEKAALEKTFTKYNYVYNEDIYKTYIRINHNLWNQYEKGLIDKNTVIYSRFVDLFQVYGIDGDGIAFENVYQELLAEGCYLIDGVIDVLDYLYHKYDLYIVTNGVAKTQIKRLKTAELEKYMKDIFISEIIGFQKPKKEFFDYCFNKIEDIDPKKTMIVGDSLSSDIKGGNNAGITTCWYNPNNILPDSNIRIDYTIRKLSDLYDIL